MWGSFRCQWEQIRLQLRPFSAGDPGESVWADVLWCPVELWSVWMLVGLSQNVLNVAGAAGPLQRSAIPLDRSMPKALLRFMQYCDTIAASIYIYLFIYLYIVDVYCWEHSIWMDLNGKFHFNYFYRRDALSNRSCICDYNEYYHHNYCRFHVLFSSVESPFCFQTLQTAEMFSVNVHFALVRWRQWRCDMGSFNGTLNSP